MRHVSKIRCTAFKPYEEIPRKKLIYDILSSGKKLTFIQAPIGYGKTTLLSQIAESYEHTLWLSLNGETDIISFLGTLEEALAPVGYRFVASECILFEKKENFTTQCASSFASAIEQIDEQLMIIMDDLHKVKEARILELITAIIKYLPQNTSMCLSSDECLWPELESFRLKGNLLLLDQKDLAFTQDETKRMLNLHNMRLLKATYRWPLAVRSFRFMLEGRGAIAPILEQDIDELNSYWVSECVDRLPDKTVWFIKETIGFSPLDAPMINSILHIENAELILEDLVTQSLFTRKTQEGFYQYHDLLIEHFLNSQQTTERFELFNQASLYYYRHLDYIKASHYAILSGNMDLLGQILVTAYRTLLKEGKLYQLRRLFSRLKDDFLLSDVNLLVAKGAFLSSVGSYAEAKVYLDRAIPRLAEENHTLYIEASVHKARVLRNFVSFEASNMLLDELLTKIPDLSTKEAYQAAIEKIYNLCWLSKLSEALEFTHHMISVCAKAGNLKVKAWYERYLCTIYFMLGKMRHSVKYYERSLELSQEEQEYLRMHSIELHASKAYQMLGDRKRAVAMITSELQHLKKAGRYEELWLGYLHAVDIHFQNIYIDRLNGKNTNIECIIRYLNLAKAYALLCRQTDFQSNMVRLQDVTCSLMFSQNPKEGVVSEILAQLDKCTDFHKTIILGRLINYFCAKQDLDNAVVCANKCISIGESTGIHFTLTTAYGVLAIAALERNDAQSLPVYVKKYLSLCSENGLYDHFRLKKLYGPILEYALENNIEKDFVRQMMVKAGYKAKKILVQTLGGLVITPTKERTEPIKMRTKKQRELFAFLLNSKSTGVTKEQISQALWPESKSDNIKKLIGVNLAYIKKDLESWGIKNPIINNNKHYSICMDEIEYDVEQLDQAIADFNRNKNQISANLIIALYNRDYLDGYEAGWISSKRAYYSKLLEKAQSFRP